MSIETRRARSRPKTAFAKQLSIFALAASLFVETPALAQDTNWIGTWMASPQPTWGADFAFPTKIPAAVQNQTFRQVIRISLGGPRFRFVFSNIYGDAPMKIGAASVAIAGPNATSAIQAVQSLSFGGKESTVILPGAQAVSDPLDMTVADGTQLVVSTWLPDKTSLKTFHWDGRATAWFGQGDLTRATTFPAKDKTDARILLSEVLVDTTNEGAVVAVGDSITDGNGATIDANTRWPDFLAMRFAPNHIAVLNAGISGGRLLQDKMGVNALARLDCDVLTQPNVRAVILLIGINDIAWPGTAFARQQVRPAAEAMIAGYRQFIALAHARNVRVIGATLTPFEGALSGTPLDDYYNTDKDALRLEINRWIRESGAFDGVIDFDRLLRDPAHPARLAPIFDSGDHLHPGDAGNKAMAGAIDLGVLLGSHP
ncbi:SGNH/GDSL hydrolase family protein [Sphingomonas abietis]|uniref:SGNH/GDSL hydrolase family protein n=1 Tax=Sphingomonas abietis TaxID=3012344 RepID=A0ABY7NK83_9SPHN|nr:SGNH/GDSL hydrolase family protein [Sphingomonas abietis]WBO20926.1 SGNH/GDSL hydrolase family protein [Sphingomonas abietis]